jgi:hypothetical protein
MPSDHHDSPPEPFGADDPDESSSIGDSSLLAPPMSHQRYSYLGPQAGPHQLQSFLDDLVTSHDPPIALATTTMGIGSAAAYAGPMRTVAHSEYSDVLTLPNPLPHSPHPFRLHELVPPPNVPHPQQQTLVYPEGYAPAESLPPQNYISTARSVPSSSAAAFFPPGSHGPSLFAQAQGATPPILGNPSPTTLVPPNSELARPPRFTFAPPGADVPADPVAIPTTTASPTSPRSWREKARSKLDKTSQQQAAQDRSGGRVRSNSWSVVSSVFRRRSGVSHGSV